MKDNDMTKRLRRHERTRLSFICGSSKNSFLVLGFILLNNPYAFANGSYHLIFNFLDNYNAKNIDSNHNLMHT